MNANEPASRQEAHVHYTAAFIGGFLGTFPVLNAVHLFGSAQTSNLIDIVIGSLKGDFKSVVLHLGGAFLYCLAVFLATIIARRMKGSMKILAMTLDAVCAFVMWRFPLDTGLPLTAYLYPTFFAMAFHWCAFGGAYGFVSATIFSSNNLRQFISALTEVFCNGDKSFSLKAKFFGATLLAFHLGVVAGGGCWYYFGNAGYLFVMIPAALVVWMVIRPCINSREEES